VTKRQPRDRRRRTNLWPRLRSRTRKEKEENVKRRRRKKDINESTSKGLRMKGS
jgi:hypothetical protein